jgi:hypothetical protein
MTDTTSTDPAATAGQALDGGPAKVADPHPTPPDLRAAAELKATDAVTQPEVAFDLDVLERENAPAAFYFRHLGERYLLVDPQEVDWQDLIIAIGDTYTFFRTIVPADDREKFFQSKMPSWKMRALMERYTEHYGLPNPKALAA